MLASRPTRVFGIALSNPHSQHAPMRRSTRMGLTHNPARVSDDIRWRMDHPIVKPR
jgi:hypothetical protein